MTRERKEGMIKLRAPVVDNLSGKYEKRAK